MSAAARRDQLAGHRQDGPDALTAHWPSYAAGYEAGVAAGIEAGIEAGRRHAEAEMDACWAETARKVRDLAKRHTWAEVQQRRGVA